MRPLLYDGTHGFDRAAAYFGPDPSKSFKPAGKMPDFSSRLLRFWEWPWTVKPEAVGARGLLESTSAALLQAADAVVGVAEGGQEVVYDGSTLFLPGVIL